MGLLRDEPRVDLVTSSGSLRITIRQRPRYVLWEGAIAMAAGVFVWWMWPKFSPRLHLWIIGAFVLDVFGILFRLTGSEIIEIDSQHMKIIKEIHGWERKREFDVASCSELQWVSSSEGSRQGLQCKAGWKTIRFGSSLSENQALEIMTELQRALPQVAETLFSEPDAKKHFVTLDLN